MEKVLQEFRIIETDDGFRIEIKGDKDQLREWVMNLNPQHWAEEREHGPRGPRFGPPWMRHAGPRAWMRFGPPGWGFGWDEDNDDIDDDEAWAKRKRQGRGRGRGQGRHGHHEHHEHHEHGKDEAAQA